MLINKNREAIKSTRRELTEIYQDMLKNYKTLLTNQDPKMEDFKEVLNNIKKMSKVFREIDNRAIKHIALLSPEGKDLRYLVTCLKLTGELQNIISFFKKYCKNNIDLLNTLQDKSMDLGDNSKKYLISFQESVLISMELLSKILDIDKKFTTDEFKAINKSIFIEESRCDDLYSLSQKEVLINKKIESLMLMNALKNLEKITDSALSVSNVLFFERYGGHI